MAEPFIGQILMAGFNFAPRGWSTCQGQLMSIAQNTAMFSLLGTTFGGNGQQTFGLPDLQGRVPVGQGSGAGLSPTVMGEAAGTNTTSILVSNLPAHNHTATLTSTASLNAASIKATNDSATAGAVLGHAVDGATPKAAVPEIYCPSGTATPIALGGLNVSGTVAVGLTGSNIPISITQPYLVVNMIIAIEGIFPSRN